MTTGCDRKRRYESQDVIGSAERVTETLELLHDTREKLKSDIRRFYNEHECDELLSLDFLDVVYGWLDCQAAITKKECADFWQEIAEDRDMAQMRCAELCDQVDALTTERDNLRIYRDTWECTAHLHEKDIERLVEERDRWRDAFEDSERMRLAMVVGEEIAGRL